jgi:hypothetical protein
MTETNIVPLRSGAKIAGIIPSSVEEVFRLAKAVASSGMAPRGMDKPEQLMVAIMHGLEIGMPPMQSIQRIAVVNGRPTIWGDAVPALLLSRGFKLFEWIDDAEGTEHAAVCTVTRPDGHQVTRRFSRADAMAAGLWNKQGPWKQYPDRMLQMRARGFAARDGAADVLSGLYITEEVQDVIDVTPQRKSSAAAKRDGTDEVFNQICADIAGADSVDALDMVMDRHRDTIDHLPMRWHDLIADEHECRLADLNTVVKEGGAA